VSANEAKAIDLKENSIIYKAKGCTECNFTGYSGRTIVNEIFKVNSEIREIILNSENSNILREHCIMGNMILLRDSCFRLIKDGITTLEEYERLSLEEFCWKGEV
jgi:type IV pilus assembly protein PilB